MAARQISSPIPTAARLYVARAVYDFAKHGGAVGTIASDVWLPARAVIVGGWVSVITTCTTAGNDAGKMAVSVESPGDIVAAIAVSDASNPWDAGRHAIIPTRETIPTTSIKLAAPRAVTFTISTQPFTAGKFAVYLEYVLDPPA